MCLVTWRANTSPQVHPKADADVMRQAAIDSATPIKFKIYIVTHYIGDMS